MKMWVARDSNGELYLYVDEKPIKNGEVWENSPSDFIGIDGSMLPEVKWSDEEPTEVELVIKK